MKEIPSQLTIVVDELRTYDRVKPAAQRYGSRWCHLLLLPHKDLTERDLEALHTFAHKLGLRRAWFQEHPRFYFRHYDLTPSKRRLALRLGAQEVTSEEWIQALWAAEERKANAR